MSSIFTDKARQPTDEMLAAALGPAWAAWNVLCAELVRLHPRLFSEWKHYVGVSGWQFKFLLRKRNVLYLLPHEGSFLAGTALRVAGVAALRSLDLPASLIQEVESSKEYPEGRPARWEVRGEDDVAVVLKIVAVKLGG